MTADKLTRKERDRLLRENDFLDAAERLFAESGYDSTSMEDIAREAEYATGTVYRYFSSKETLYNRILLRKGSALFEAVKQSLEEEKSPMHQLAAIIHKEIDFFYDNAEFMRIYMNQVNPSACGRNPPEEMKELHKDYTAMVRLVVEDGIKKGVFRKLDADLLLLAIKGMFDGVVCNAITSDSLASRDDVEAFLMSFLERGIITSKGRR